MAPAAEKHKKIDRRGRLTLGPRYANRTVVVREHRDRLEIVLGKFVPASEAWLYENPEALTMVRKGLQESREGAAPTPAPDLAADAEAFDDSEG